jgi:hypothetical protein
MAIHRGPAASVALLLSTAINSWYPVQSFLPPTPPKWGVPTTPHSSHDQNSPHGKASSACGLGRRLASLYGTPENAEYSSTSSELTGSKIIASKGSTHRERPGTPGSSTRSRSASSSATISSAPGRAPTGSSGSGSGKEVSGNARNKSQAKSKGKPSFEPPTRGDRNSVRRAFKQAQQMLKQGRVDQGKEILKCCLEVR